MVTSLAENYLQTISSRDTITMTILIRLDGSMEGDNYALKNNKNNTFQVAYNTDSSAYRLKVSAESCPFWGGLFSWSERRRQSLGAMPLHLFEWRIKQLLQSISTYEPQIGLSQVCFKHLIQDARFEWRPRQSASYLNPFNGPVMFIRLSCEALARIQQSPWGLIGGTSMPIWQCRDLLRRDSRRGEILVFSGWLCGNEVALEAPSRNTAVAHTVSPTLGSIDYHGDTLH